MDQKTASRPFSGTAQTPRHSDRIIKVQIDPFAGIGYFPKMHDLIRIESGLRLAFQNFPTKEKRETPGEVR